MDDFVPDPSGSVSGVRLIIPSGSEGSEARTLSLTS